MAHLKNWQPQMTANEAAFFEKAPKALLFEIARSLASIMKEDDRADAFALLQSEWEILHMNGIVPQKPMKKMELGE